MVLVTSENKYMGLFARIVSLINLIVQVVLESIGVSIWQIALAPLSIEAECKEAKLIQNGYLSEKSDDEEESGVEDDSELDELDEKSEPMDRHLAAACDDGCVRIYYISDSEKLTYYRSLPRVSGENSLLPLPSF